MAKLCRDRTGHINQILKKVNFMNEKALRTLEYYKIIEQLESFATCSMGKALCRELTPLDEIGKIEVMQQETADALARIYQKGSLSFGGVKDVRGSLKRLEVGSTLGAGELLAICSLWKIQTVPKPTPEKRMRTSAQTPWTACLRFYSP